MICSAAFGDQHEHSRASASNNVEAVLELTIASEHMVGSSQVSVLAYESSSGKHQRLTWHVRKRADVVSCCVVAKDSTETSDSGCACSSTASAAAASSSDTLHV